jgi:hypothetical protein
VLFGVMYCLTVFCLVAFGILLILEIYLLGSKVTLEEVVNMYMILTGRRRYRVVYIDP